MRQLPLFELDKEAARKDFSVPASAGFRDKLSLSRFNSVMNKISPEDRAVHEWYRFVLSFPPHLVSHYINKFGLGKDARILDPFCGTGTTLVEAKKQGITGVGIEANSMAYFASRVKVDWGIDPDGLTRHAHKIAQAVLKEFESQGISDEPLAGPPRRADIELRTLNGEKTELLLKDSISPLPLHKSLVLLDYLKKDDNPYQQHELLAFATALVNSVSNLRFGPEVGAGEIKHDAPVVNAWLNQIAVIASDLKTVAGHADIPATVYNADARQIKNLLPPDSIDAVITSPPYPNEKDYTRTTRLESVLLGFLTNKADLRAMKQKLLCSNTRTVYKGDDDDRWVSEHGEIQAIAEKIENRRIELGKTSGFERLYPRVTRLYFGGMARHLDDLRSVLRPGAYLAYVVGDQASYLQVMIRTGQLLADIALSLGYKLIDIDLFRTRLATATREQLREEVVILQWPG